MRTVTERITSTNFVVLGPTVEGSEARSTI